MWSPRQFDCIVSKKRDKFDDILFALFLIALLSNKSNSQEWTTFQLAIDHINLNKTVLPNTTVKAFEGQVNQDNILEYGKNVGVY